MNYNICYSKYYLYKSCYVIIPTQFNVYIRSNTKCEEGPKRKAMASKKWIIGIATILLLSAIVVGVTLISLTSLKGKTVWDYIKILDY